MQSAVSDGATALVSATELRAYIGLIFSALGAEADIAEELADSLVSAELAGRSSHGARLLPFWASFIQSGQFVVNAQPELVDDLGSIVRMDAKAAMGPVVGHAASALAIERARRHGIALVLVRDVAHLGRLGEHTEILASAGLVGILLCNCQGAGSMLASAGAAEARLSNNSLSIAMPSDTTPVILDMALSMVSQAQVQLAQERGERLPQAWILDKDGKPSDDPSVLADGGAMLPLGGKDTAYKGTGLVILIDLIVGVLSGGGVCRTDAGPFRNAFAMIAINPDPLVSPGNRTAKVEELRAYLKQARRLPGVEEILLPGERGSRSAYRRSHEGIPIDTVTLTRLADLALDVGVEPLQIA